MVTTLYKPPGLMVFPPHGDPRGDCLLRRLLADQPWRNEVAWPLGFEGGIAHRLDNATSGAVLAASSLEELEQLRQWFAQGLFRKTYRMLAARTVPWTHNSCDKPIAHSATHRKRMVVQRGQNTPHRGKWYPARSQFRHLHDSLFEVVIETGVTHQIRVHAAFLGIPILGDRMYGGGLAPADAPPGVQFFLHHLGLRGPDGFHSDELPLPPWAQ